MLQKISRPPSVLITQVILIMLGGLWLVGGLLYVLASFTTPTSGDHLIVNPIFGPLMLAFSISFLIAFWGLVKRKGYGRWIGVIGMSLLLLSVIAENIYSPAGRMEGVEGMGSVFGVALFYGLIVFLIYRLARGKPANAFFAGEGTSAA